MFTACCCIFKVIALVFSKRKTQTENAFGNSTILSPKYRQASRALHSKLLTELLSWFSSRDEFSRVETSSEGSDITVPTRSDPNFCEFLQIFANFSQKLGSERVFASRKLPKYFRNSKKVYFRNSQKRKFWKKTSNAGPYKLGTLIFNYAID